MWLEEISSCSSLTVLSGFAWVLLNKIYQPFFLSPVHVLINNVSCSHPSDPGPLLLPWFGFGDSCRLPRNDKLRLLQPFIDDWQWHVGWGATCECDVRVWCELREDRPKETPNAAKRGKGLGPSSLANGGTLEELGGIR